MKKKDDGDMMEILDKLHIKTDNPDIYTRALTHTSYSNEHEGCESYERLEFLGDAVLEVIISDFLYNEKHLEDEVLSIIPKIKDGLSSRAKGI